MNKDQLWEKVADIIENMMGIDRAEIIPGALLVDDLGADSLDSIELVMAFEEAFDIDIADEDAEKIRTVRDIVDYLAGMNKVETHES